MDVFNTEVSRARILPLFPEVGRKINYTTAAVYGAIVYLAMVSGRDSIMIDRDNIANLIGVKRGQIGRCMNRLIDKGWLEREDTGEWRPLRWKRTL